jgi:CCT motif
VDRPEGWIGAYSPDSRRVRIERFIEKRNHRVWTKSVKYDVRKNFADSRLRVKGRFVKKEEESLMRELMSLT